MKEEARNGHTAAGRAHPPTSTLINARSAPRQRLARQLEHKNTPARQQRVRQWGKQRLLFATIDLPALRFAKQQPQGIGPPAAGTPSGVPSQCAWHAPLHCPRHASVPRPARGARAHGARAHSTRAPSSGKQKKPPPPLPFSPQLSAWPWGLWGCPGVSTPSWPPGQSPPRCRCAGRNDRPLCAGTGGGGARQVNGCVEGV